MKREVTSEETVRIGDAARALGVSVLTLKRWERRKIVKPLRDGNGVRFFTPEQLDAMREHLRPREQRSDVLRIPVSGKRA